MTSVAGVPGDPNTYYAGAASGGLWKSTDGGIHWFPVFDSQPVSSVGALAVAPSDPNVVYAGTGEPFTRSHISAGWGMFRSTDAGQDVVARRSREHRAHLAHRRSPDEPGPRLRGRVRLRLRPAARARHLSIRTTAARTGSACCS